MTVGAARRPRRERCAEARLARAFFFIADLRVRKRPVASVCSWLRISWVKSAAR
jgi:hypothetical protein